MVATFVTFDALDVNQAAGVQVHNGDLQLAVVIRAKGGEKPLCQFAATILVAKIVDNSSGKPDGNDHVREQSDWGV